MQMQRMEFWQNLPLPELFLHLLDPHLRLNRETFKATQDDT